ncbi:MAG: DNA-3-methyladenine glycosylase [Cyclobacteriaceae bacterium]|nr:DNA-3-methyladenine glycosylase [Cyclobacteriaceae bacterium]
MPNRLPAPFYTNPDVVQIAQDLIGCKLCTKINGVLTSGIIVETEAYNGRMDKACHAFPDKRTPRTQIMYEKGGIAYIYFVYGMHYLFNVVTNKKEFADAVLIRAIEPTDGLEEMYTRREMNKNGKLLTGGPARLAQALGIDKQMNGESLQNSYVWIEPKDADFEFDIKISKRIGVDYAGEDAHLPWRFSIIGNPFVSK